MGPVDVGAPADPTGEGSTRMAHTPAAHNADTVAPPCGVCGRPAEVVATVPMCGERPRYPMCHECFEPINWSGYAEEVEVLP